MGGPYQLAGRLFLQPPQGVLVLRTGDARGVALQHSCRVAVEGLGNSGGGPECRKPLRQIGPLDAAACMLEPVASAVQMGGIQHLFPHADIEVDQRTRRAVAHQHAHAHNGQHQGGKEKSKQRHGGWFKGGVRGQR